MCWLVTVTGVQVEASVNTVLAQRKKVDYSPRDLSKVARFAAEYIHGKTPMQQYADELHNRFAQCQGGEARVIV